MRGRLAARQDQRIKAALVDDGESLPSTKGVDNVDPLFIIIKPSLVIMTRDAFATVKSLILNNRKFDFRKSSNS